MGLGRGKGASSTSKTSCMSSPSTNHVLKTRHHHVIMAETHEGSSKLIKASHQCMSSPHMNVSCHHQHHVITIMAPRHHIAWDPTTCINEDYEDIRHHQGISKLHHHQTGSISIIWAPPHQTSSISIITINQTIKGPSSALQGSMNIIYRH